MNQSKKTFAASSMPTEIPSVGRHVYPTSFLRVKDLPCRERPRELLDRLGVENLSDTILLALILRSGRKGISVVEVGQRLLRDYGSLAALARASLDELAAIPGMGRVKAQVLKSALELARRLTEEGTPNHPLIRTPEDAAQVLRGRISILEQEIFWVLELDAKNRLKKEPVEISQGLLNASLVHPREVFRDAVRSACAALVLVHNHPSGDPTPSAEDIRITKQLVEVGRIVDIQVLDHIILVHRNPHSSSDYFSLRESGTVDFSS